MATTIQIKTVDDNVITFTMPEDNITLGEVTKRIFKGVVYTIDDPSLFNGIVFAVNTKNISKIAVGNLPQMLSEGGGV